MRVAASLVLSDSPLVAIGGHDDREEYLLSNVVGAVRLSDGRVVVADGQPRLLRYYDPEGVHLRTVGGEGGGPGEFGRISSIALGRADTVIVWDADQRRLSLFSPGGDVASIAALPAMTELLVGVQKKSPHHLILPGSVQRLRDGRLIVDPRAEPNVETISPTGAVQDTVPLIALDRTGEDGAEIGSFPGAEYYFHDGIGMALPFGDRRRVTAGGDAIYVGSTSDGTIRIISPASGEVVGSIELPVERRAVSDEEIELTRSRLVDRASSNLRTKMATYADAIPFPDSLPVLSDLKIGSDQRLWVQLYNPPSETTQRWLSFSSSGELQTSITMDGELQLLDVAGDYVLVRFTDELDVQEVRLYRLFPSP